MNYPQYPLLSLISSVTGLMHNRIMTPNIQEYFSLSYSAIALSCSIFGPITNTIKTHNVIFCLDKLLKSNNIIVSNNGNVKCRHIMCIENIKKMCKQLYRTIFKPEYEKKYDKYFKLFVLHISIYVFHYCKAFPVLWWKVNVHFRSVTTILVVFVIKGLILFCIILLTIY